MTDSQSRGEILVDSLIDLKGDKFGVWKYFEDRADRLGEQLWSTGTWLVSLIAATFVLPFAAEFIVVPNTLLPVRIASHGSIFLIAAAGIGLCCYSYFAMFDIRNHIEGNWRRAMYARTGKYEATWGGRKASGWRVLRIIGTLAFVGFGIQMLISLLPYSLGLTESI